VADDLIHPAGVPADAEQRLAPVRWLLDHAAFFDPDAADEPRPVSLADLEHHTTAMLQNARTAWLRLLGATPHWGSG
jgi:hypothetical protein